MTPNPTVVSVTIAGSEISLETGRMARQAGGAVVVRQGDTQVLATATAGGERDIDFLPLTVEVEERMYSAGKIPGSFFKREGRASEKATLVARMIDRPIRPLFPKNWRRETQLVAITLPLLAPTMVVALLFRLLDAVRVFDLIYVLTGGGPGTATEPLALYTFNTLLQNLRFGYGSALSVLIFVGVFGIALAVIRSFGAELTGRVR